MRSRQQQGGPGLPGRAREREKYSICEKTGARGREAKCVRVSVGGCIVSMAGWAVCCECEQHERSGSSSSKRDPAQQPSKAHRPSSARPAHWPAALCPPPPPHTASASASASASACWYCCHGCSPPPQLYVRTLVAHRGRSLASAPTLPVTAARRRRFCDAAHDCWLWLWRWGPAAQTTRSRSIPPSTPRVLA